MRSPRFTIAGLMLVVAGLACNAAIARLLYAWNPEILIGIAMPLLAFELAVLGLYGGRRPGRAFWAGFLLGGALAMITFIWDKMVPVVYGITSSGTLISTTGSPFHSFWSSYGRLVTDHLQGVLQGRVGADPYDSDVVVLRALIWSLPQAAAALLGGLLAWVMSKTPRWPMSLDGRRRSSSWAGS